MFSAPLHTPFLIWPPHPVSPPTSSWPTPSSLSTSSPPYLLPSARLYTLLSSSDPLTLFSSPSSWPTPSTHSFLYLTPSPCSPPTSSHPYFSCPIFYFTTYYSNFITALLGVYRFLAVTRPFITPSSFWTLLIVGIMVLVAGVMVFLMMEVSVQDTGAPYCLIGTLRRWNGDMHVTRQNQNYHYLGTIASRVIFMAHTVFSVLFSVCGGIVLFRQQSITS